MLRNVASRHVASCRIMSHYVTSFYVMSRHVTSCHVMSRHVTSCHVMSHHVTSCHVMPRDVPHVTSWHVMSRHVISRNVTSCHVTSCHVMSHSCPVMSRHVISCYVISRRKSRDGHATNASLSTDFFHTQSIQIIQKIEIFIRSRISKFVRPAQRYDDFKLIRLPVSPSRVLRAPGTSSYHLVPKHLRATWPRPEQSHLLPWGLLSQWHRQQTTTPETNGASPPEPSDILKRFYALYDNKLRYYKKKVSKLIIIIIIIIHSW